MVHKMVVGIEDLLKVLCMVMKQRQLDTKQQLRRVSQRDAKHQQSVLVSVTEKTYTLC